MTQKGLARSAPRAYPGGISRSDPMRLLSLLLLLVALAGCDTFASGPSAALTVSGGPAGSALLVLKNTGDTALGTGALACSADLEVETDRGWQDAAHEPLVVCPAVLLIVQPGESVQGEYPVKGVPGGTYRFRVRVEDLDRGSVREVVSNRVRVAGDAA